MKPFAEILSDNLTKVPYLPSWDRNPIYQRFHQGLGHLKFDSIHELVEQRYWWPTLRQDLKYHIQQCTECQLDQSTSNSRVRTKIHPIPSVALPFERWGLDFVQDLKETKSGNRHIITAIDYATRWVVAKVVPNRDAVTVASFLYELMMNYGLPFEIFTDRGSAFLSEGVREFEKLQRIRHHATTPYHPQTNEEIGQVRSAAYACSKAQAEAMRIRNKWDPDSDDYYFKIGDMVKLKNHTKNKFEFDWKGPYHIVDVGYPETYWIMEPSGRRFDSTVSELDLAPWLQATESTLAFYDGTSRDDRGHPPEEGGSVITPVPNTISTS
ncbi:hypothetical protein BASA81_017424 [Batrachochytrium salamandrivorans]|nr:hypothetical protein BASA81_017424 [Batrachochytrium salamandrivorans]